MIAYQMNLVGITGIFSASSLIGSIGLFTIAAITSLFSQKIGASIGTMCLLLTAPWIAIIPFGVISDTPSFRVAMLLTFIPILLVIFSSYYSIKKSILNNNLDWDFKKKIRPVYKYSALTIHLIIIILWSYSYLA
jgi:putative effector of murein hydrolase LrgA (UPF0299 family)